MIRPNLRKDRLDLWQPDVQELVGRRQCTDWYAVTGMAILVVSAILTAWMIYQGVPVLVRLLVTLVDQGGN